MAERIPIAADHAGYELKEKIAKALSDLGFDVKDLGTHSPSSTDYADYAHPLAQEGASGDVRRGVGRLGTGPGVPYAATGPPRGGGGSVSASPRPVGGGR